jgi:hypothetical protein
LWGSKTERVRVHDGDDGHGDLGVGGFVAAGASIEFGVDAGVVSGWEVFGVSSGRLELLHHKLIIKAHGSAASVFSFLVFDGIVLDVAEVTNHLFLPILFSGLGTLWLVMSSLEGFFMVVVVVTGA